MGKVQSLVGAASLQWGLMASGYTVHGGNKVLCTVRGIELQVNGFEVARVILKHLEVVWGIG